MLLAFKRAFTDLNFYVETSKQAWKTVLALFLVGLFGINLLNGTAESLIHGPKFLKTLTQVTDTLVSWWPPNQVAQWQNQTLSFSPPVTQATVSWPIALPDQLTANFAYYQNTEMEQPPAELLTGSSEVLFALTPTKYWVNELNGHWSETVPLKEFPGLTALPSGSYDKATFTHYLGKVQTKFHDLTTIVLFLWPILSGLLSWVQNACFVLIESSLVYLVVRLLGWKFTWTRLAKLSFLLMLPAVTIQYLGNWLYPDLTWSLFHLTYWIILSLLIFTRSTELERTTL